MKTSELTGKALNAAVAIAQGWFFDPDYAEGPLWVSSNGTAWIADSWMPSTDWEQGGPIIDENKISVRYDDSHKLWQGTKLVDALTYHCKVGKDMLEAGLRCFVLSRLGDAVELPEGLKL